MSWNYRVIVDDTGVAGIHEVYYNEDTSAIESWSEDPVAVSWWHGNGQDEETGEAELEVMSEAFERPWLRIKRSLVVYE